MRAGLDLTERLRRLHRPGVRIDRAYGRWLTHENRAGAVVGDRLISVVMPVCDTPACVLRQAIASVRAQTSPWWELCIADDASTAPHVGPVLDEAAHADRRVRVVRLTQRGGIASASNAALGLARGAFVALLDHDDVLAPHALAIVADEVARFPQAELIFSDEDRLEHGRRARPYFKPGWNLDLMLGHNLVSHLGVYRRARVLALGGFRAGFEGSQDYDLALRVAQDCGPARIRHIPRVLYHWRQSPGSYSASHAARASDAARRAVQAVLPPGGVVLPDPHLPHWNRVVHPLPANASVSVLVAGGEAGPDDPDCPVAETMAARDWRRASGTVLVFLAPGLVPDGPGWLRELASQAMRPGVGAAGGRLDRADGRIWHSGSVLDRWRIARTLCPRSDMSDPGYAGHFRLARTVSAVSGDCLAIRRDRFVAAGGFDAACGRYGDVDLCLRLGARGLRCVWTPYARLRVMMAPQARADRRAARLMRARWGDVLACDPYLNPNLLVRGGNLVLRHRPARAPWSDPA